MKNLKIRTKLMLILAAMLVGFFGLSAFSMMMMSNINDSSTIIAQNWLPSVIAAEELNTATSDYRIWEMRHVLATSASEMREAETKLTDMNNQVQGYMTDYLENLVTDSQDEQLMREAQTIWTEYLTISQQMISISTSNNQEQAMRILTGESLDLFNEVSDICLQLVDYNSAGASKASSDGDATYASASRMMIVFAVAMAVVISLVTMIIIRGITNPVKEIDGVAKKIAEGNLDEAITYQSKDELGVLAVNFNATVTRLRDYVNYIEEISSVLNEVAGGNLVFTLTYDYAGEFAKVKVALENISESLNSTMGQINQAADQVAAGSDQVSSGAQALSQGSTEQASSTEELAATINEVSDHVKRNAENARQADQQATETARELEGGKAQMKNMTGAMSRIDETSQEIGKIIKTIEDIAFQTNILALNAAVEAARAGEAGKGFAVVADEVRNLAGKSAEASKNTAALIEAALDAVKEGTGIATETAESLDRIVDSSEKSARLVQAIAQASQEQAASIAQITAGIDQISSVVQTNSATAEESAAASEELSSQAQVLKNLVSQFKLRDGGSSAASSAPASSGMSSASMGDGSKY